MPFQRLRGRRAAGCPFGASGADPGVRCRHAPSRSCMARRRRNDAYPRTQCRVLAGCVRRALWRYCLPRRSRAVRSQRTPPAIQRTTTVYGVLGVATPVGFVGVEGVHRFGSRFQLSLGVGEGYQALKGGRRPLEALQLSLMPRLRLGGPRAAFTLGMGASVGRFALPTGEASGVTSPFRTNYALWITSRPAASSSLRGSPSASSAASGTGTPASATLASISQDCPTWVWASAIHSEPCAGSASP